MIRLRLMISSIVIVIFNVSFLSFQPTTTAAAIGGNKVAGANHTGDGLLDGSAYNSDQNGKPRFIAVTRLEDVQAVRCAEFHPHGSVYAVGSNSKTLRICAYPKVTDIRSVNLSFSLSLFLFSQLDPSLVLSSSTDR